MTYVVIVYMPIVSMKPVKQKKKMVGKALKKMVNGMIYVQSAKEIIMLTKMWKHFKTICKHKWYVFLECRKMGITWQGIAHDLSKLRPCEFIPSAKYYTGTSSPVANERNAIGYSYAWRHHKGVNMHHWQWYIDPDGWDENGQVIINPAPMPDKYIKEMYCDMVGAAKAYGNGSAKDYYLKFQNEWVLHSETKEKFEKLLGV